MIYDCPQCQAPQPPGVMVCRNCGVEFDGPVPEDAIMPEEIAAAPGEITAPEQVAQIPEPGTAPPPEVFPPAAEAVVAPPVAPEPLPLYTPPYAPVYAPPAAAYPAPVRQGLSPLSILLIVVPLALLLIGGTIFAVGQLNQDTPAPAAAPPPVTAVAAPVATGPPTFLHPGSESAHAQFDPATRWLVGRWVASKSSDYYVFKDNGSGYRGNLNDAQQQTFLWYILQKQLVIYSQQQEKLPFSEGADDNTLFLRAADGRSYKTYLRTGDNG